MSTTTIIVFSVFVLTVILGGLLGYDIGSKASEDKKK